MLTRTITKNVNEILASRGDFHHSDHLVSPGLPDIKLHHVIDQGNNLFQIKGEQIIKDQPYPVDFFLFGDVEVEIRREEVDVAAWLDNKPSWNTLFNHS